MGGALTSFLKKFAAVVPLCLFSSKNGWIVGGPPTADRSLFERRIHDIYDLGKELRDVARHIQRRRIFVPGAYLNIFCAIMGNLADELNNIYERMY